MASELQRLVDGLARRLGRVVAIDDRRLRLLAYSSHEGQEVDPLRQYSILNRQVPPDVTDYTRPYLDNSPGPKRIPPAPELGLVLPRVAVPIRDAGVLLGWIMLLDASEELAPGDLDATVEAAHAAATILQRDRLADAAASNEARAWLPALLGDDPSGRADAVGALVEKELFVAGEPAAVIVAVMGQGAEVLGESERTAMETVLGVVARGSAPRRCIGVVRADHAVWLVSTQDPLVRNHGLESLGRSVVEASDRIQPGRIHVGIGNVVRDLSDAALSYSEARRAAQVTSTVPTLGRVVSYEQLGVYAVLARIPREELSREALPGSVRTLLDADEQGRVVETLECFLDNASSVRATAEALGTHRATVYYRLERAQEIAGADLARGDDRLVLHVGLKLARLAGLWR